jgi:uncharacterized protein YqiB (DUF1249 family)
MRIKVNSKHKTVEALSFMDSFGAYQKVYPYSGNFRMVNVRARYQLNRFLSFWLGNIITQGFRLETQKV